jgi:O-antigen/teichoic acid export membrane protein
MLLESIWVLLTRLVQRGANLLVFMLLARALTPAELGFYGYVVSTALVLSVAFDLGLRQGAAAMIGQSPDRIAAVASNMAPLWLALALAASAAAWAMLAWGGIDAAGTAAMTLAVLAIAPMLLVRMGQGLFLGTGHLRHLNQSELVSRAVLLLLTLALWALDRLDLTAALGIMALSQLSGAAFVLARLRPHPGWRDFPDRAVLRELLGRGLGFAGAILLMILSGRLGVWMVAWLLSPAETGSYFAALRLAEMLVEVATSVGVVVFSHGVRMSDGKAAAMAAAAVGRIVAAGMACGALVAGLLAEPLLGWLLGAGYGGATAALRWALAGAVASCLVMVLYPGLSSRGHAAVGVWLFGAAVLVNGLVAAALIPTFGVSGAAAGFAAGQWAAALATGIAYHRLYGLGWGELLLPGSSDLAAIRQIVRRKPRPTSVLAGSG